MDQQTPPSQTLQKGFDELQEHVVITDTHGTIVYANKAVEQTTGYPLSEVIGKNPGQLWGGKMPKEFYENMWHVLKDEKQPFVGEVKNVRKDGTEYWQELHVTPVLNEKGDVQYYIGIEPVITERKKKEQFRDEFFSIARHQIMNPLTKNNIILDLLLSESWTGKNKEYIQQLYKDNLSIMTLINDLVFLDRMENHSHIREDINISDIIDETYGRAKASNPTIVMTYTKEGSDFTINSNETLVRQVINNIVTNSVEYTASEAGTINIILKDTGNEFAFSCADNGVGIPEDEHEKIFQKFYRASNASTMKNDGSGLGLYIVKKITDELGWKISFTSTPGKGTTFFVTIPKK